MFDRYLLLILFSICSVCLHGIIMATDCHLTISDAILKPKYDRESKCSIAISSSVLVTHARTCKSILNWGKPVSWSCNYTLLSDDNANLIW